MGVVEATCPGFRLPQAPSTPVSRFNVFCCIALAVFFKLPLSVGKLPLKASVWQ